MKRIVFTKENRDKARAGIKTQTRRIGENPLKAQAGEVRTIAEPTQVLELTFSFQCRAQVLYPDTKEIILKNISVETYDKLMARKDWSKPAIARFMLDDFARHFVKITAIKVEPLQAITPQECYAEGIRVYEGDLFIPPGDSAEVDGHYLEGFIQLWDSINKGDRSWDNNPTVTAYSYEFLGGDRDV